MSLLLNILWLICGGFLLGVAYMLAGLAISASIIGIPFGWQAFKLGLLTMAPFGTELVEYRGANNPLNSIFNFIWFILFGWWIALGHLAHAIPLFVSIIGIPFAIQHLKLIPVALFPFGRGLR